MEEKWYLINNTVLMHQGEIFANPFESANRVHPSVTWVVENRKSVQRIIRSVIYQQHASQRGIDVEDCFQYILERFSTEDEDVYNSMSSLLHTEMSLSSHCVMRVRKLTQIFIKQRIKETRNTTYLLNSGELTHTRGVNIEDICMKETEDPEKESWEQTDILFYDLCNVYQDYFFVEKGYTSFSLELYFTYMYFSLGSENLALHINSVADRTGISLRLISLVTADLKAELEKRHSTVQEILQIIRELNTIAKETGWKPPLLRGDA